MMIKIFLSTSGKYYVGGTKITKNVDFCTINNIEKCFSPNTKSEW